MNRQIKKVTIFILIMAMVLSFAACGSKNETLATVQDTTITQEQVDGYVSYYSLLSFSTPKSDLGEAELSYLEGAMLDFAVEIDLLKAHYKDEGVTVLPDDYDTQFKEFKKSMFSQGDDIQKQLSDAGISNETLDFFFSAQFYTKKFMDDIDKEDPVTDTEIEKYYNKHKDEFVTPAQIKASHILIKDEKHTDAGRTSIEAIKAQIEGGKSFESMAKKYSDDGSAVSGGALGDWFDKNESYVQEFKDAAFALKKGEMSDVVETEYGYHLIKVTDTKAEQQKTLKESSEEIEDLLREQNYAAGIESLKNEIGVEYTAAGQKMIDKSKSVSAESGQ